METFSIWDLNKDLNYQDVIEIYQTCDEWKNIERDPFDDRELEFTVNIRNEEGYVFTSSDGTEIQFSEVNYRREKVFSPERNNPLRDKRVRLTDVTFYVFEHNDKVRFIALRGSGGNTLTALRAATNCVNNNDITADDLELKEDFFYWIFQRHMNFTDQELYPESNIYVDALTGYSGSTRDLVNDMWGRGNRISRILVTLAFLFNNDSLKSLTPDFKLEDDNLEVELTLSGTFKFNIESHMGSYFFEQDLVKKKACLTLLFVLDIFPIVRNAYENHLINKTWGADHQLNFIAGIGSEIQDRVNDKLTDISLLLKEDDI